MPQITIIYRLMLDERTHQPTGAVLLCPSDEKDDQLPPVAQCQIPLTVCVDDDGWESLHLELPQTIQGVPLVALEDYALDKADISMTEDDLADIIGLPLVSLGLPKTLVSIHPDACNWLSDLQAFQVSPENPVFEAVDGVLYHRQNRQLVRYPAGKADEWFIVREGTTGIAHSAFSNCENLLSILLPEGVESLGDFAFASCSQLEYVALPQSLQTIGDGCFLNCSFLPYLRVPSGVASIGKWAFQDCTRLLGISLPMTAAFTHLGDYAFERCGSLQTITLPPCLTHLPSACFADCTSLEQVHWQPFTAAWFPSHKPDDPLPLESIGYEAFRGCTSLREIQLPEGLHTIRQYAFSGCRNLKRVQLPASLGMITPGAKGMPVNGMPFSGCLQLEEITVAEGNPRLSVVDGALLDLDEKRLIHYPAARREVRVQVPAQVQVIGMDAFRDNPYVEEIVLPQGLTSIGYSAFANCTALCSIRLPATLHELGTGAFQGCTALESISVPEGCPKISSNTFAGCTALHSVTLPVSVWGLEMAAFEGCTELEEIILPEGISMLDNRVFAGCISLRRAMLPRSLSSIAWNAFANCPQLKLYVPRGSNTAAYVSRTFADDRVVVCD